MCLPGAAVSERNADSSLHHERHEATDLYLVTSNPTLSSFLENSLPKPDLSGLASNLVYLSQNIYKAIPVTRLSDRSDSLAYN